MRGVVPIVLCASVVAMACSDESVHENGPAETVDADGRLDEPAVPAESMLPAAPDGRGRAGPGQDPSTTEDTVVPDGFDRVQATVTEPDGTVCELCLWLADTPQRRSRGLMFVTDLGPADGMAFVYPTLHSGSFWMKNTLLPLSIAFFGADGANVGAFDMEPCEEEPCAHYPTPDGFLIAIETISGGLADLGIGPGSVLDLTDEPCADPAVGDPSG